MTNGSLVDDLARRNVHLWTNGERLIVRAKTGVLTPELRAELSGRKEEVIAMLRKSSDKTARLPRITPRPEDRYRPFPLTEVQRAYWVGRGDAFDLGNVSCHIYYEIDAKDLDLGRFNHAFQFLIYRHDMLRAVVLPDGRQRILEYVPAYEIKTINLRELPETDSDSVLADMRAEMSHQVLPSDQWPLFDIRATLLDDERVRIHFSFDTLIVDVLSLQILLEEWRELYMNPNVELTSLDLSFRDYVMAEESVRASKAFKRSQKYWSKRAPTLPSGPKLPLALAPSALDKPSFTRHRGQLSPEEWALLKRRAVSRRMTLSGLLLAVFAGVLARWSGSPRFAINVTLLNRLPLHPDVNRLIGDLTSLLPVEIDGSTADPFESWAAGVQSQLIDDLDHCHMGSIEIMRNAARSQGKSAITLPVVFTSLLNQKTESRPKTLWMGEPVYGISQTPQVWLDHQVFEEDEALFFQWDAVEDLFPPGFISDMFDTYRGLLSKLAQDDSAWSAALDAFPEYQFELSKPRSTGERVLPEARLQDLFVEQARTHPDQTAVVFNDVRISYRELDIRSNQIAHQLRILGAIRGSVVAVVMERSWEQAAAVIGVLKAGAAYLPIDPSVPRERLWYLLENGGARIALTQPRLDRDLEWPDFVKRLSLGALPIGGAYDNPLEPAQTADDLAYVIYTSGSTGQPKGVMITHRSAVNTIVDINSRFGVGTNDRVLALSELTFDLSVFDIFGALAAGATIVVPNSDGVRDPSHWLHLVRREEVTIWNSVPALMEMMTAYCASDDIPPLPLRLVLMSGDWIPVKLPNLIKRIAPDVELISLGGATEASIWSIFFPIEQVDERWKSIPYGRPLKNQWFYVLNEHMQCCPVWVPGELYIAGDGLAQGYWRDERKTCEAFVVHPVTGERLYKTGDIGRCLPDGNIEFMGRRDSQVKIQGYRIELGEIEAALAQHPAVESCVVKATGSAGAGRRLVAFVITKGYAPTGLEMSRFLQEKLPSYMIPSAFVPLDSLPLTANGKIDRAALPDAPSPKIDCASDQRASTVLEEQISNVVADILSVTQPTRDADFFELGATSLEIVRIARVLEQKIGFAGKIADLFQAPTVEGLARIHEQSRSQVLA
ncbi:MAG: non-ribosomal peptide synthetase [Blastocatellia bacterium AA13]|nr:MAG: non-ribosomal peptide synthetase [Blastocatellia bacterium AA13]